VVALNRFANSRDLQMSGYSALVDAEKDLLRELAGRIAASLVSPRL